MVPKKQYTADEMAQALQRIASGVPVATVAKQTGIPRTTLLYKSSGKSPKVCGMGPATILTSQEETFLVQWIILLQQRHFPITKTMLLDSVEKIVTETRRNTPFKNNRPGDKWYKSFLRRHPEISPRVAQNLTPARENVTERQLRNWFAEVKDYLLSNGLFEITNMPKRVFNADESAFYLNPKGSKILARKGDKNIYSMGGDEKENLTILLTANADGQIAPPMVLFTYVRVPGYISTSIPSSWAIGNSENGWMCSSTFYEYITNIFVPWLDQEKIERPVLFFVDGHASHLTLHLSNFCSQNGIELIALFPNSTHLLQPMDVAVFRPLKNAWKTEAQKWRSENGGIKLQKQNFGSIFVKALEYVTNTTVKNGFRVSGICPFDVENVKFEKISKPSKTRVPLNESGSMFLRELKARIPTSKIEKFESCLTEAAGLWNGEVEDTSLFNLWKDMVESLNNTTIHTPPNSPVNGSENTADLVDDAVSHNNEFEIKTTDSKVIPPSPVFETPIKENEVAQTYTQSTNLPTPLKNVPSPFKRALFWPEPSTSTKKKKSKEKIPSVVTSEAWRKYNTNKDIEKKRKLEEKEQRKLQRELNKKRKFETKKLPTITEDSETSEEEWKESDDSLADVDLFEVEQDFCETNLQSKISIGDYLLIKFFGGKRKTTQYRYVCVVQNLHDDENEIEVMCLNMLNEDKTMFRMDENDISSVNKTAVLGKLPPPMLISSGDRIKYKFVKPVDVYEAP